MPDDNDTLPILDDIIVPGDVDKAVKDPVSKAQDSLWDNTDSSRHASVSRNDSVKEAMNLADASIQAEGGDEFLNQRLSKYEPQSGQLPDIEALTEKLIDDILPELEQLLRDKIRERLQAHCTKSSNDT